MSLSHENSFIPLNTLLNRALTVNEHDNISLLEV